MGVISKTRLFGTSKYLSIVKCALKFLEWIPLGEPSWIFGIFVNRDNAAEYAAVFPPAAIISFASEESMDLNKFIMILALNWVRLLPVSYTHLRAHET